MTSAVVLAGGLGTRLRTYLPGTPKILAPVHNTPFLYFILQQLVESRFDSINVLSGHITPLIESVFGNNFKGTPIHYSPEPADSLLGTGGAVKNFARNSSDDCLMVVNGDTFLDHRRTINRPLNLPLSMNIIVCVKHDDTSRYGKVLVNPNDSSVESFCEKPDDDQGSHTPFLINSGTYYLSTKSIANHPKCEFSLESEYLPLQVQQGRLFAYNVDCPFIDIGVPSDYIRAASVVPTP